MNVREILALRKKNCTLEHKNMLQNKCDRLPIQKNTAYKQQHALTYSVMCLYYRSRLIRQHGELLRKPGHFAFKMRFPHTSLSMFTNHAPRGRRVIKHLLRLELEFSAVLVITNNLETIATA